MDFQYSDMYGIRTYGSRLPSHTIEQTKTLILDALIERDQLRAMKD